MEGATQQRGAWGEDIAVAFLIQQGYTILERNFWTRNGEIDIIAGGEYDGMPLLRFVEVKTRLYADGSGARAVNWQKMKNMQFAARLYCLRHQVDVDATMMQFVYIAVCGDEHNFTVEEEIIPSF